MQSQHLQHQNIAATRHAILLLMPFSLCPGFRCGDVSACVASQGNPHSAVGGSVVIQMNAQEIHLIQQLPRGFAVPLAPFMGPVGKPRNVMSVRYGDDAILMPRHGPVVPGCLVERDYPGRDQIVAKHLHIFLKVAVAGQGQFQVGR